MLQGFARVQALGFRVQGLGFSFGGATRICQGSGVRVQGSGGAVSFCQVRSPFLPILLWVFFCFFFVFLLGAL